MGRWSPTSPSFIEHLSYVFDLEIIYLFLQISTAFALDIVCLEHSEGQVEVFVNMA